MISNIFHKTIKNILVIGAFSFFFLVIATLLVPRYVSAIGLLIPFGGRILSTTPCDNGLLITVGAPRGGAFLYQLGVSRLYQYFSLTPGAKVLGTAFPGGVCLVPPAVPIPAEGTIRIVGTSLF